MKTQKILGIVGWKNSGKTTLVEALVREMTGRGLQISTVKHAHHAFDIDVPGKDSHRHRVAGAQEVIVTSGQRWALMHELRGSPESSLDELLSKLAPCDLVLVEGFKHGGHPKIEVARFVRDEGLIADQDDAVIAVATDNVVFAGRHPALPLNDAAAIIDFIGAHFGLPIDK
ncbi:MAG: molybdopterin-guanine dinucleotide biosynthesis protein B [Rhizomicrobium sp.]